MGSDGAAAMRLTPSRASRAVLQPLPKQRRLPTLLVEVLERHGLDPAPTDDEGEFAWENRTATSLMASYRDTRDAELFEALHRLVLPSLERWIVSLLRRSITHLDAREIAQDAFVNVYLYPSSFRDDHPGSFRVWVRTIAGNLVRRSIARSRGSALQALPESGREPADPREGPERAALRAEQSADLRRAWALLMLLYLRAYGELAPRDREALRLVEVEGLGYLEAGARLGVGRSNMKMIVFRARRRISRRLQLECFAPLRRTLGAADAGELRCVG
ncbi:MAG: sigma-70 family RNA polymerase sigma factor [Planctomycetota bacterium]|nr:MAG: sigma-70 family RNA polymerase sigma factor [Planctomycetota bacterium]